MIAARARATRDYLWFTCKAYVHTYVHSAVPVFDYDEPVWSNTRAGPRTHHATPPPPPEHANTLTFRAFFFCVYGPTSRVPSELLINLLVAIGVYECEWDSNANNKSSM